MRNSIGLRLGLGYLVLVVLILALGMVGLWFSMQVQASLQQVASQSQQLVALVQVETAIERVDLSLQSSLVDRTAGGLARSEVLMDTAKETAGDGYGEVAGPHITAAKAGAINATRALSQIEDSQEPLQMALGKLKTEMRESINATVESAGEAQAAARTVSLLISAGAVVLGIVLAIVVGRSITRPLGYLVDAADKLSTGDLETPIQLTSKDEIGELGASLERMRVSLKVVMDRVRGKSAG
jgi:methyl-accepting chemotaxis protein